MSQRPRRPGDSPSRDSNPDSESHSEATSTDPVSVAISGSEYTSQDVNNEAEHHGGNTDGNASGSSGNSGNSGNSGSNNADRAPPPAAEFGLYQLMDAVFGRQLGNPSSGNIGRSTNDPNSTVSGNTDDNSNNGSNGSGGLGSSNATGSDGANVAGETTTAASIEIPPAPEPENGDTSDNSGAIVITVNYMFMEGGDQTNPGRTGSLVVTLPNNATNREPRIISLFISLATRMAYSALVTNAPKVHPGVTLDKFNSFVIKNARDLADSTCSICFEEYDTPVELPEIPKVSLETIASKKRKLGINSHCVSATSSTDRLPESPNMAGETPGTDTESVASDLGATASTSGSTNENDESRPKYLCEHNEEYNHLPVQMPCGHIFGQSCLSHWLKANTSCPLCRVSVADAQQQPQVTPISYIRFGGLNNSTDDLTAPLSALANDSTSSDTTDLAGNAESNREESGPGLLDRATLVLFNPLLAPSQDESITPLLPNTNRRRSRNSAVSPVIENILNYFGRARRQREADASGGTSLFASGVSSRRTSDGVETVTSDHFSPIENFHNFTSLTGHNGTESTDDQNNDSASSSNTHVDNDNNDVSNGSNEDN